MSSPPTNHDSLGAKARHRSPSLRLRLTVWMVVIALVIQLTLGLVIFLYQTSALDTIYDERIRLRSDTLIAGLEDRNLKVDPPEQISEIEQKLALVPSDFRVVAVFDAFGKSLWPAIGPAVPPDVLAAMQPGLDRDGAVFRRSMPAPSGDGEIAARFIVRRFTDKTGDAAFLVFGRNDATFEHMVVLLRRVLFLSLPVGIFAAGAAGWLIAGLAMVPVKRLREVAGALSPESIEQPMHLNVGIAELEDIKLVLEETRERIRHAFHVRDRFIANVSHELKTPIAVILTEAQTLDQRTLTPEARTFVRSVVDEMRRLGRTIESFLTLTKIRAGKSLMDNAPCTVADIVMDSVLNSTRAARQNKITINPLLGDSDSPRPIMGDCELLRIMVDNLLRNAIRYSPEGSQVIIHVTESASECTIAVRDYGPHLPLGALDTIAEPFAPARTDAARTGRTVGLGVSIAQSIADLHGGRIDFTNITTNGCEFFVRLPYVDVVAGKFRVPATAPISSTAPAVSGEPRPSA